MRSLKLSLISVAVAVLVAACGGGGGSEPKLTFTKVVTFGDSLSDPGAYRVGSVAALGGGKFTVNGGNDKVWTEALAANLGLPAQCAAQTGLLPNNGATGEAVKNIATCFNYAQGSSRATAVGSGPNGVALQQPPFNQVNLGLIADSIQNQMTRHATKVGTYDPNDVVTVNGGGNDFFMQLGAVGAAAGGGAAAVGAGTIAGWPAATLAIVAAGGPAATQAAGTAAVAAMGQAGAELATNVRNLVIGKGARFVLVRGLGDLNVTPLGQSFPAATKALATGMVLTFNGQLKGGTTVVPGVIFLDDYARSQAIAATPAAFGYSNLTVPVCGPNAFSAPGQLVGSSIVCNASNLRSGSSATAAFADEVHPTPFAHQDTANFAMELMRVWTR